MDPAASQKRIKGASSACPLPEELVEDILSSLPAKSLLRFQCVSRSFHALIASRAFQDAHLRRHSGARRLFIKPPDVRRRPFYAWQPGLPVEKILGTRHLPQGPIAPATTKSCHGLMLLNCLDYQVHCVWNPSTGEIQALPDRIPARSGRSRYDPDPLVSYGLGYCSDTRRHKVVRMYHVGDYYSYASTIICEVFTVNESAYWRPTAVEPPQHYLRDNRRQGAVLCNGNQHFIQRYGDITTFNVRDETFGVLKPPPELQGRSIFELTVMNGCLCAYIFTDWWNLVDHESDEYPCDVWMLRDYATVGTWEKLKYIDWGTTPEANRAHLNSSWIAPLDKFYDGNNRERIMFGTGSGSLFTVDPSIGTPEVLFSAKDTVIGECHSDKLLTMGLFEESLARVHSTSKNTILCSPSMQAWLEVLSRLPARTVGTLNQVCRGWRAMIMSERFVAAHRYNANLNKSPQLMFFDGKPNGFVPVERFVGAPDIPPLIRDGSRLVCSKPCLGLNAGSFGDFDFVCNPITGYFKALPLNMSKDWKGISSYDFLRQMPWDYNGYTMFAGRLGLGYDQEASRHVLARPSIQREGHSNT